jgi:DNA repair exonuclease SbcCD ATPase subunit
MKIHLQNFRCYVDETFDFGVKGLSLLSGPSGQGKSSIMMGIYFALFGSGSKVVAYGKSSCKVELWFDGMHIVRTKRPNILVVDDIYEDEAGQSIINKKFGDTFNVTGYISQNALNSFILMSPVEKLGFLEKFAFRDVDLVKIKCRNKALISKRRDALIETTSKLEIAESFLKELELPEKINFPVKCKISDREKVIKNEKIKHRNCHTKVKREKNYIKKLEREINDIKVLDASVQGQKDSLSTILKNIQNVDEQHELLEYDGDHILKDYKQRLETLISRRNLCILETQYETDKNRLGDMKVSEIKDKQDEITQIDSDLWSEYTNTELIDNIKEYKQCIRHSNTLKKLKDELIECDVTIEELQMKTDELTKEREILDEKKLLHEEKSSYKTVYECPCCLIKLNFNGNSLHLANTVLHECDSNIEEVTKDIKLCKKNISMLEKSIPVYQNRLDKSILLKSKILDIEGLYEDISSLDGVSEDLEYLIEYQYSQQGLEKRKEILKNDLINENFSASYQKFTKSVEILDLQIRELTSVCGLSDENMKEDELRYLIRDQKHIKDSLDSLLLRKKSLYNDKERCSNKIEKAQVNHIETYGTVKNIDTLLNSIETHISNIKSLVQKRIGHEKTLTDIESWKKYYESITKYNSWKSKVVDLSLKEKEDRGKYSSSTILKEKILEAESIAMLNIIDSINIHAQLYLDSFFVENPISARLVTFKKTKKSTKPQINIEIEYKGMEADMNMLSGGELSRVILAYTLALGEMFSTPLVLLDECTSSLDQELTDVVFDAIREHFNGKLVLIVAHQVVTGTFDNTIRLGSKVE